jgi:hypothetical protein
MDKLNSLPSGKATGIPNTGYLKNLLLYSVLVATLGCRHGNDDTVSPPLNTVESSIDSLDSGISKYIANYKKEFDPQGCKYSDLYAGYLGYFTKTSKGKIGL